MKKLRILSVHLLNDLSGSPRVLAQALDGLQEAGHEVHLLTSEAVGGNSCLDSLKLQGHHRFRYRWSPNKGLTLLRFLWAQIRIFMIVLAGRRYDVVYVNTLLPFGAALAARLRGFRVVYHLHEVALSPRLLHLFLDRMMALNADRILAVSPFLTNQSRYAALPIVTLSNSVPEVFYEAQPENKPDLDGLMLCNLKVYKGIHELVALARALPNHRFGLVLNAPQDEVAAWVRENEIPNNLVLQSATRDVLNWYSRSRIILNLSRSDEWVETFGMTALEAMALGKPILVPTVGGIADLLDEGVEGYHVEGRDLERLQVLFLQLLEEEVYARASVAARKKAALFHPKVWREILVDNFQKVS